MALASNEISNEVEAYIANADTSFSTTAGGITVGANESARINAVAAAASASIAIGGTAGVALAGAGAEATNVIATKIGSVIPDSVFVFCAHFDATSNEPFIDTPGADDNGTGTVTLLTAARLLSTVSVDYTIKFVAFDREEQGLVGSSAYVDAHAQAGPHRGQAAEGFAARELVATVDGLCHGR